jgi:hypothetical protein
MTLVVQAGYFAKNNFLEVMERNIQALLSHPHISNFKGVRINKINLN